MFFLLGAGFTVQMGILTEHDLFHLLEQDVVVYFHLVRVHFVGFIHFKPMLQPRGVTHLAAGRLRSASNLNAELV